MKNNKDTIVKICNWIRDYNSSGERTPSKLYQNTGYSECYGQITEDGIELVLRNDPKLIDLWETFSMDKRWSPAWYFICRTDGRFEVGYYHDDSNKQTSKLYKDPFKACSVFIKMEMEELRKLNS